MSAAGPVATGAVVTAAAGTIAAARTAVASQVLPSVVTIEVAGTQESGSGSGVILDKEGHVLTNTHVVTLGGAVADPQIRVTTSDGHIYAATVVGTDPIYDLAVIKLKDAKNLTPIEFTDSSQLNVGDTAIAVGALVGGYFGAHLAKRMPEWLLRGIIVAVALFALALGGFGIGSSEFVSMGLLPGIAHSLLPQLMADWPEQGIAHAGWALDREVAEFGRTLGEELLTPTRVYAADLVDLLRDPSVVAGGGVHGLSHVTGGGLAGNTARVVPDGLEAVLDRGTWALPAAVRLLEEHGVPREESERAFNCGVGMVAAVSAAEADRAVSVLAARGVPAWVAGTVGARPDATGPAARLVGSYS